jgi:hypothetical protein
VQVWAVVALSGSLRDSGAVHALRPEQRSQLGDRLGLSGLNDFDHCSPPSRQGHGKYLALELL